MGERITLSLQIADDLWNTVTDPYQLENAIFHLVINAREAISAAGIWTLRACNAGACGLAGLVSAGK